MYVQVKLILDTFEVKLITFTKIYILNLMM